MKQYQRSMYQTEMNQIDEINKKVQAPIEREPEWSRKELRETFYSKKDTSYVHHGPQRSGHGRAQTSFRFDIDSGFRFNSGEQFIEEVQKVVNFKNYKVDDEKKTMSKK